MFASLIEESKKKELLTIARLINIFDLPLLWDGKSEKERNGECDLRRIAFNVSENHKINWSNFIKEYEKNSFLNSYMEDELLAEISKLKLNSQNNVEKRFEIAEKILKEEIIKDRHNNSKEMQQSRIILFEVMRSIFMISGLTDLKRRLLQIISIAYKIDGEDFNELLAQATSLHKEMKRTINLVLE